MGRGAVAFPLEAVDPLAAGGEDLRAAVAVDVADVAAVDHRERFVDLPDRPWLGLGMGRQAERPEVGRLGRLHALRAGTEKRNVDQFRPAVAVQIAPADPMHDRIDRDGVQLPGAVEIPVGLQPLDVPALGSVVEIEAAGQDDLRPAVAVDVVRGHVDVGGRWAIGCCCHVGFSYHTTSGWLIDSTATSGRPSPLKSAMVA